MTAEKFSNYSINVRSDLYFYAPRMVVMEKTRQLIDFFRAKFVLPDGLSVMVLPIEEDKVLGAFYPSLNFLTAVWGSQATYQAAFTNNFVNIKLALCFEKVLFHELVHANQAATGRMVHEKNKKQLVWEGQVMPDRDPNSYSLDDYMKLPWEAEAFGTAETLYQEYQKIMLP